MRPPGVLLFGALLASAAWGAPLQDQLRADLQAPQAVADASGGEALHLPGILADFYAGRDDAPLWLDEDGTPLPIAWDMLGLARRAGDDGLHPEDYHLGALESLFAAQRIGSFPPSRRRERAAALELLLSDAFLLLSEHERNGRVNPAGLDPLIGAHLGHEDLTRGLRVLAEGGAPDTVIQGAAPRGTLYTGLRSMLAYYRLQELQGGMPAVPAGPALQKGDAGPRVAALIARLEAEGDLPRGELRDPSFDDAVMLGLKRFQARNGLSVSGVMDGASYAALNEPARARIDRIRVNLERLRWISGDMAPTRLTVNIAEFRASLYENDTLLLSEPAIVGQLYRQTPEFSDRIRYLVVNPAWDVPPIIAGEDLLPKIQADPDYLENHGYQVLQGWNSGEHPVDERAINWQEWTADTLPYRLRQLPGPENALGRVKFMFPNRFGVYLHDTPAQGLFAAERRTFSSGCIRVAQAMDLAAAVLRLDGHDAPERVLQQALDSGAPTQIEMAHPLPIYIVYLTAWVDEDSGVLQFRPDVYGRDAEVLRALDAPLSLPAAATRAAVPAAGAGHRARRGI